MSVLDCEGLIQLGKHYGASYDHQYATMSVLDSEGLKQLGYVAMSVLDGEGLKQLLVQEIETTAGASFVVQRLLRPETTAGVIWFPSSSITTSLSSRDVLGSKPLVPQQIF